jgi:hypothetical protein
MILKVSHKPPTRPMIVSHSGSPKPKNTPTPCLFPLNGGLRDLSEELSVAGRCLHLVDQQL